MAKRFHEKKPLRLTAIRAVASAILFSILLLSFTMRAQRAVNADSLFAQARNAAFQQKDNASALRLAKDALRANAAYTDILVFIGRVYAWESNVDSSRTYLQRAVVSNPSYEDAYLAYSDLNYWNTLYDSALYIIGRGLAMVPASQDLLLRKAKVLTAMKDYKAALSITDTLLQMNGNNAEARALNLAIKDLSCKRKISIKADYVHFDKQFPDDWQFANIEYTEVTKLGPLVARINIADRFKKTGLQYEAEMYPRLSKIFYGYLNLGYSAQTDVFPKWRSGASVFANLPHAFEAETGIRYLYFNSNIFFYTLYIGKYYKRFLFGARTFLTPANNYFSSATGVLARYYYGGTDDYLHLGLMSGISPDDRRPNLPVTDAKLHSYLGEFVVKKAIAVVNVLSLNFSVYNQEYLPGVRGNQFQAGIGYSRRF